MSDTDSDGLGEAWYAHYGVKAASPAVAGVEIVRSSDVALEAAHAMLELISRPELLTIVEESSVWEEEGPLSDAEILSTHTDVGSDVIVASDTGSDDARAEPPTAVISLVSSDSEAKEKMMYAEVRNSVSERVARADAARRAAHADAAEREFDLRRFVRLKAEQAHAARVAIQRAEVHSRLSFAKRRMARVARERPASPGDAPSVGSPACIPTTRERLSVGAAIPYPLQPVLTGDLEQFDLVIFRKELLDALPVLRDAIAA